MVRYRKPSPIVFLDIDGVLCLGAPYNGYDIEACFNGDHPTPHLVHEQVFACEPKRALAELSSDFDGTLRFVISSSWRQTFDRRQLAHIFRKSGLGFVVKQLFRCPKWATPIHGGLDKRADEIGSWLKRHHRGEPFVILDDEWSGSTLVELDGRPGHPWTGRIVLCKVDTGLTLAHLPGIRKVLQTSPIVAHAGDGRR
jgi:hypothetical protein